MAKKRSSWLDLPVLHGEGRLRTRVGVIYPMPEPTATISKRIEEIGGNPRKTLRLRASVTGPR